MGNCSSGTEPRWLLYLVVSIGGAAVLTLEILGTRILGPYYGVSLFLWSALITVTLSALSVGYAVGGKVADRKASMSRLGVILALAGLWSVLIPVMKMSVIWITGALSLRPGVMTAALILFFPPLFLLGMVSPFAIKLRTVSLDEVGRSAGNLYAVSTVASVVAAILTGFVLIPNVGVSRLTVITGVALLLAGALCCVMDKRRVGKTVILAVFFFAFAVAAPFVLIAPGMVSCDDSLVAFEQSPYAELRVVDYMNARFLLIDGAIHTFTDISSNESLFQYVNVIEIPRLMFDKPGDMLLVGLGGGSLARNFTRAGWKVDAVEIDPVVTRFAYEYFGLKPGDANVYTMDGRRYLRETKKKYDLIILDAFGSGSVPFHLVTAEAFEIAASRLKTGGILAMNLQSIGWKSTLVKSVVATLETCFSSQLVLPIAEPPNKLGNIILLASNRQLEISGGLPVPESRFAAEYDRTHAWDNSFVPGTDGVSVLTDEHNPVDLWSEQINLVERRELIEYFKDSKAVH